jgi:ubiquinone biosynthesis protein COQ4
MLKVRQAIWAGLRLARDPFEFQSLNAMVDAVSLSWPVQAWYRRLVAGVPREKLDHLRALTRRPIDFEALARMPENTFGYRYAKFFDEHGIKTQGHIESVPELMETFAQDWVTHRLFKIHDILHCIAGFGADVPAEMGLQMFDFVNLREPYGLLAVLAYPYMVAHYGQPVQMAREIARGYTLGRRAGNLFFAPFEEMWAMDYDDARKLLGFADA